MTYTIEALSLTLAPGIFVSPERLLRDVVTSLAMRHNRRNPTPFWDAVSKATYLGGTYSCALCRWAGYDPESGRKLSEAERGEK